MDEQPIAIQERWLEVNGLQIHCLAAGDKGSTVVLLHGAGVDSARLSWELAIGPLSGEHQVFAPDLPGYGQSEKPNVQYNTDYYINFLVHLLDTLHLSTIALVGLSMGGAIALGFTLQYPERVTKLVAVDPYGIMPKVAWHKLAYLYVVTPFNEWSYSLFKRSRYLTRWALLSSLISSPERLSEKLIDDVFQAAQEPKAGRAFMSFQRHDISWSGLRTNYINRLHEITVPTLFINGEKDPGVPLVYAKQAHEAVRHSQLYVMQGCLHWPMRDKPDEFNRVVKAFLPDQ